MPVVPEAVAMHARTDAGLIEQVGRPFFDHSGSNAPEHVLGAALLEDDVGNALPREQLPQQQARGTGPDDDDLCAQD